MLMEWKYDGEGDGFGVASSFNRDLVTNYNPVTIFIEVFVLQDHHPSSLLSSEFLRAEGREKQRSKVAKFIDSILLKIVEAIYIEPAIVRVTCFVLVPLQTNKASYFHARLLGIYSVQ
jgi:hypothetical protein